MGRLCQNGGELPGDETADFEGEQDMLFWKP